VSAGVCAGSDLLIVHLRVTLCLGEMSSKGSHDHPYAHPGTGRTGNQTSEATKGSATPSGAAQQPSARTATVNLPFVTATFRRPDIHLPQIRVPNRQQALSAAQAVQSYLPSPRQAAYFGGLAALAAFEVLEWPVALAIGAGTALMGRSQPQPPSRPTSPQRKTELRRRRPRPLRGPSSRPSPAALRKAPPTHQRRANPIPDRLTHGRRGARVR